MEKLCEFCKASRPIIYCSADAAHLCLSCDATVHSANALSFRHPRALICDACRCRPARVRCLDHDTFLCRRSDSGHHAHRRRDVGRYTGSPSAVDLAAMWGLDLSGMDTLCVDGSKVTCVVGGEASSSCLSAGQGKVVEIDSAMQSSHLILQQIMDLDRIQLSEGTGSEQLARKDAFITEHKSHSSLVLDFEEKEEEPFPFPFLQNEKNEIWMQDLGAICHDIHFLDDANIPDVDLTFKDFKDSFRGEEEDEAVASRNDSKSSAFSFVGIGSTIQLQKQEEKSTFDQTKGTSHQTKSAPSFSASKTTAQSSGSDYRDDGHSPASPCSRKNSEPSRSDKVVIRYKGKKIARPEKPAQYASARVSNDKKRKNSSYDTTGQ